MMFLAQEWPPKDPSEFLDYSLDWSEQLKLSTPPDTIATTVWTVPDGITGSRESETNGITTIWITGGTAGQEYMISCRITTSGGRVLERTRRLRVREL